MTQIFYAPRLRIILSVFAGAPLRISVSRDTSFPYPKSRLQGDFEVDAGDPDIEMTRINVARPASGRSPLERPFNWTEEIARICSSNADTHSFKRRALNVESQSCLLIETV